MDILIITNFGSDFSINDNERFLYLAKQLSQKHNVEIITSDFMHERKEHRKKAVERWPFKITFLHEPGYKKNVCINRFLASSFNPCRIC